MNAKRELSALWRFLETEALPLLLWQKDPAAYERGMGMGSDSVDFKNWAKSRAAIILGRLEAMRDTPLGLVDFEEDGEKISFVDSFGDDCSLWLQGDTTNDTIDEPVIIISVKEERGVAISRNLARALIVCIHRWLDHGSFMPEEECQPLIDAPDPPGSSFIGKCREAAKEVLDGKEEDAK